LNAKEAAWELHLENVQLRGELAAARNELDRARRRAERWERSYRQACLYVVQARKEAYRAQVRALTR
jgi:hypothetical protein